MPDLVRDPLFAAAWPQAVAASRNAAAQRRHDLEERTRAGEFGPFAQALQLEFDEAFPRMRADFSRQAYRGMSCDTVVFDEAAE